MVPGWWMNVLIRWCLATAIHYIHSLRLDIAYILRILADTLSAERWLQTTGRRWRCRQPIRCGTKAGICATQLTLEMFYFVHNPSRQWFADCSHRCHRFQPYL
uniref:Putative secreted protein n=1 Tax=Anopheles darlingi TaxID=43151 RepID=A0A2M4DGX7_ANODA